MAHLWRLSVRRLQLYPSLNLKRYHKIHSVSFMHRKTHSFQYSGDWYGVLRFPGGPRLIDRCEKVTYIPNPNGSVKILERGVNAQGQFVSFDGIATVPNPAISGVSQVVFSDCKCIFFFCFCIRQKPDLCSYSDHSEYYCSKTEFLYIHLYL